MPNQAVSNFVEKAIRVLKESEDQMRRLVVSASEEGDYEAVEQLARFSKELRRLQSESTYQSNGRSNLGYSNSNSSTERPVAKDFPQFFRERDKLLLVGWSTKNEDVYEQRAPKEVLDSLVNVLLNPRAFHRASRTDRFQSPRLSCQEFSSLARDNRAD